LFRAIDNAARRISGLPTQEDEDDPFGDKQAAEEDAPEQDDLESPEGQADEARKAAEEAVEQAVEEAADAIKEAAEKVED
jgi:hypothetical protein